MNSFSGIIKKRKTCNKETFLTVVSEVISGFLWDIFVTINEHVNTQNNYMNYFVETHKIKIDSDEKLPVIILNYFEDNIVHFESVKEVSYELYFIWTNRV